MGKTFDRNQSEDEMKTKNDERELNEGKTNKHTNGKQIIHKRCLAFTFAKFVAFIERVTPSTGGLIIGRLVGRFIQIQFVSCIWFHQTA